MSGLYTETSVQRKTTARDIVLKAFSVFACTILLLLALLTVGYFRLIFIFVATAAIVALIWYWPKFNVEWEYVYCDGQMDFDMILGGEKRKHVLRIELEDAAVVAPQNSAKLDGYQHLPIRDYTSLENEKNVYGIATAVNGQKCVIYFEPTDKMLDLMKVKCPNAVEYTRR